MIVKQRLVFTVTIASLFVVTTVLTALVMVKIASRTSEKYSSDGKNASVAFDENGTIAPDDASTIPDRAVPETNSPSSSPWKEELETTNISPPSNTFLRSKFPYNLYTPTPPPSIKFPTQPVFVSTPSVVSVVKPAKQPIEKPTITSHFLNIFYPPVTSPSPSVSLSPTEEDSTSPSSSQTPSIAWTIPSPIPSDSPTESTGPPKAYQISSTEASLIPSKAPMTPIPTLPPTQEPSPTPATQPPTFHPTASPIQITRAPSRETTLELTGSPTSISSASPTKPSTQETTDASTSSPTESTTAAPTKRPIRAPTKSPTSSPTKNPTESPTKDDSNNAQEMMTRFYAIGDVPYTTAEEQELRVQMAAIPEDAEFVIHVGDIRSARDGRPCEKAEYENVAEMLRLSRAPVFIVPGDNEWNDCPNVDEAWGHWHDAFGSFDEEWTHNLNVTRPERSENFVVLHKRSLFIGLNLVGGRIDDQIEWTTRLEGQFNWVKELISTHTTVGGGEDLVDSVAIFGHCNPASSHDDFFEPLKRYIRDDLHNLLPILYLNGDAHAWKYQESFKRQSSWLRITVEGGTRNPPLQVTVVNSGTTPADVFTSDRQLQR